MVAMSGEGRNTVGFELSNGDIYSVEELMGMVLAHAKDQAEIAGEEPVDGAVITVCAPRLRCPDPTRTLTSFSFFSGPSFL